VGATKKTIHVGMRLLHVVHKVNAS